ncbi:MAG: hypothetical protein JSV74_03750 [Dehalococcoidia bacterium]|nr:MAG: hypothetical protein JSV74_03750 [Dehalococcoidia bacterium]
MTAEIDDTVILAAHKKIDSERRQAGTYGLVGGLDHVIINTEQSKHMSAIGELMNTTGLRLADAFEDESRNVAILTTDNSANFMVTARTDGINPFLAFNQAPKSAHLPNTRLETLVFSSPGLEKYVAIQKNRGVRFMTDEIIERRNCLFIQTVPSLFTGNSIGFIQWTGKEGNYRPQKSRSLEIEAHKPPSQYLDQIQYLDHIATRVEAKLRDRAIIEFMELTNYSFDFAIYIKKLNSITSVARLTKADFALVFTSGISKNIQEEYIGPTEMYVRNYGARVHHMAFHTEDIDNVFHTLKAGGVEFLSDLVGSPEEGLKQAFTKGSNNTLLVNEYIHRFGDFDGFFTKSNVETLTKATEKQ